MVGVAFGFATGADGAVVFGAAVVVGTGAAAGAEAAVDVAGSAEGTAGAEFCEVGVDQEADFGMQPPPNATKAIDAIMRRFMICIGSFILGMRRLMRP